jgi:hypothetical protein
MSPLTQVVGHHHRADAVGEDARVEGEHVHAHDPRAAEADAEEEQRQHRHHHQARDEPRHEQVLHRVDGHRLQRVNLLGGPHVAELGGHARARPRGHHDGREHRRHLPREREGHHAPDHVFGPETTKAVHGLQREDHARKEPHEPDEEERLHPDKLQLLHDEPQPEGPTEGPREAAQREVAQGAHLLQGAASGGHQLLQGRARPGAEAARGLFRGGLAHGVWASTCRRGTRRDRAVSTS